MKTQTLADVFPGADFKGASRQLFGLADVEKTAELADAESVDGARSLVDSLVARATDRMLDVSLLEVLAGAWTKMAAIQEYAIGEKMLSKKTHKYALSEHKITSTHAPTIELMVYNQKVAEVKVQITLTLLVAKTILRIKQGRILAVKISGCQGTGKVSCFGQVILEKETTELEFPGVIKLGSGIEIPPPLKLKVA